jgi:replicative DNA helicase
MDVVYITLELSEKLTSKRLDTMVTGIESQEIMRRIDEVELKVKIYGKKSGNLKIKYLPGDCTTNTNAIRAYLKEYEIQTGKLPDAVAIDYLDELDTNRGGISVSDIFMKDKYVTSELRQMAIDLNFPLITASQLNRSSVDEPEQNQAMIGGGLSKIQKADNVISLYASAAMKDRGEFQCTFLKTRSSAGVDSKVFVKFDSTSLRISDLDDDTVNNNDEKRRTKDVGTKSKLIAKKDEDETEEYIDSETGEVTKVVKSKKEDTSMVKETPTDRLKRLRDTGKL